MIAALHATGLRIGYGRRVVIPSADLTIERGRVTTIIGPNGSGKSTLLRAVAGLSRPMNGVIEIDGIPLSSLTPRDLALRLSMLPQSAVAPDGLTVADLVARGRQPHQRWYRQWTASDESVVLQAMTTMDVASLATRPLDELSGGQRQRAWIAMCLAQDTPLMLLDEPTTHLDISHSVGILETVRDLSRAQQRTVLMVLHDLSLAARYSDRLVVMRAGEIHAQGTPGEILTDALMRDVFDIDARVFPDPDDGTPTIAPRARLR